MGEQKGIRLGEKKRGKVAARRSNEEKPEY